MNGNAGMAMAFLLFNLICAPCFAAIGAMHRELGSWRKTGIAILYQTVLAYMVATIFYQFYNPLFGGGSWSWMVVIAVVFLLIIGHFLFNKDPMRLFAPIASRMRGRGGASS